MGGLFRIASRGGGGAANNARRRRRARSIAACRDARAVLSVSRRRARSVFAVACSRASALLTCRRSGDRTHTLVRPLPAVGATVTPPNDLSWFLLRWAAGSHSLVGRYAATSGKLHANTRDINVREVTVAFHGSNLIESTDFSLNYGNRYGCVRPGTWNGHGTVVV